MYEMKAEDYIKLLEKLQTDRKNFENLWQDVADLMLPNRDQIIRKSLPGQQKGTIILDNTGVISLELLAAAMHTLLTNPSELWFQLTTGDAELDDKDGVRQWLQRSANKIRNVLNNSNFQTEVHETYIEEAGFGTGVLSCEEDEKDVVVFMARPLPTVFLEEDQNGRVCGVHRKFEYTAEEAAAEYGLKQLPEKIQKAFREKVQTKFKFIHCVRKIQDYGDGAEKPRYPIESKHINVEEKVFVKQGGFYSMPYITPRWMKIAGEKYGRGPGMSALPDMKMLNAMTETTLRGAQKVVDPPLQAPDDGFIMPIITKPGGLNYYRAGTTDILKPIFNDARIDFGFEAMDVKRKQVREAFYVDQLKLKQDGPMMTATEILQRTEEAMRLMGPILGRQTSEFLRPLFDRVMDIMDRRKMFDPLPPELMEMAKQGKGIDVQYSSMVALAQRSGEAQNVLRTLQASEPFINMDPQSADNFDADKAIRIVARSYNFPQQALRKSAEIESIRAARAKANEQQIQQEQEMAQAEQLNKAASAGASMAKAQKGK